MANPGTGTSSPVTVTTLTNGVAYRVRVRARNAVGFGPYSPYSDPFTPSSAAVGPLVSRDDGVSVNTLVGTPGIRLSGSLVNSISASPFPVRASGTLVEQVG